MSTTCEIRRNMENPYQTTAFVKQDPELALTSTCPFLAPERSDCNKEPFADMDLAGFLGEKLSQVSKEVLKNNDSHKDGWSARCCPFSHDSCRCKRLCS